jgi:hypothetical protein
MTIAIYRDRALAPRQPDTRRTLERLAVTTSRSGATGSAAIGSTRRNASIQRWR